MGLFDRFKRQRDPDEILEEVRRGREHFTSCLATVEAGMASQ